MVKEEPWLPQEWELSAPEQNLIPIMFLNRFPPPIKLETIPIPQIKHELPPFYVKPELKPLPPTLIPPRVSVFNVKPEIKTNLQTPPKLSLKQRGYQCIAKRGKRFEAYRRFTLAKGVSVQKNLGTYRTLGEAAKAADVAYKKFCEKRNIPIDPRRLNFPRRSDFESFSRDHKKVSAFPQCYWVKSKKQWKCESKVKGKKSITAYGRTDKECFEKFIEKMKENNRTPPIPRVATFLGYCSL